MIPRFVWSDPEQGRPAAPPGSIQLAIRSRPYSWLLIAGGTGALALRLGISDHSGAAAGGSVFALALLGLAIAAGWRGERVRLRNVAVGLAGGLILIAGPILTGHTPRLAFPASSFPLWVTVIVAVAIAEEIVLRGVLFDIVTREFGLGAAVIVTTILFGLVHVPLYGLPALPVDLAVGLLLAGLRVITGSVTAPAAAHVVADLAGWWLL